MEAVNGVSDGDKGAPTAPSPLTGCYLLVVIGEPHSQEHKDIILQRIAKGLLSWDASDCYVDLEKELAIINEQAPEGEDARYGERLIQFASENLVTEILIHPAISTLTQCMKNLLSSFTRHRHVIHSGYTFAANGSWILQDGTFSLSDFTEAFQEIEVQRILRAYDNSISLDIHCSPEGDWTRLPKETFTKNCKVRVNPDDVLTSGSPSIVNFLNYISPFLIPTDIEMLLESSDVVGNIRFSHPTLYVFPGGQGDAALFGINGFNMLVDGGFARKACFWDFVRHLDRLDAVLLTRLNNSNVNGISSILRRKKFNTVYPQIGHFFCNIQERKAILSPDGDKDKDPLLISLLEEGQELINNLRQLNLQPQVCYRDVEPINLYHKVGHGTLDMYVISPARDSKEVKEFLQKWNNNDQRLFANQRSGKDFTFPIQNIISICALLVWQPASASDNITRILFPGSTPQHKIFEGLDRLKQLECIKYPSCSAKTLTPNLIKSKQTKTEKFIQEQKDFKPKLDAKIKEEIIKNGHTNGFGNNHPVPNKMKKHDSTESEKSGPKSLDIKKPEDKKDDKPPEEKTKLKSKMDQKPKLDPRGLKHSRSIERKPKVAIDKKPSPTTPKKSLEAKTNGEVPKPKARTSPSATPAKSAKEATNRKVVESKYKATNKKEVPKVEKRDMRERRPVTRKPPSESSPSRKVFESPVRKLPDLPKVESRKAKIEKEGTTDSSTVSTPSADADVSLKKDLSKLTPEELEQLKARELAELKEEQEVVNEIEAVFRKSEKKVVSDSDLRKVKSISIDDKTEGEEYLIVEKEVIDQDSLDEREIKECETQKHQRDSEESEKQRKMSDETGQPKVAETKAQKEKTPPTADIAKIAEAKDASNEAPAVSPEEKGDVSSGKKADKEQDEENRENLVESQPLHSTPIESGATTAPTLPEDERIPLDEIKEDNADQVIVEKYVKEETKEKETPVVQLPSVPAETISKLPTIVGIRLDKQTPIRDIVKTPDEVADLPVHEVVDNDNYEQYHTTQNEHLTVGKPQSKEIKPTAETQEVKATEDKEVVEAIEVKAETTETTGTEVTKQILKETVYIEKTETEVTKETLEEQKLEVVEGTNVVENIQAVESERRESINEAERRESIKESERRESIKEPERRESIKEPERRESIKEPERRESIKEPERRESIKEPERKESIKEAERRKSIRESERKESIKEPERRESIKELERRESIKEPERRESIKEPERKESIKEAERRESIRESERKESIKEPERRESIKELERRESIKEPERRESIKEPERKESIKEAERRESIRESERRESIKEAERRESITEPERRESIKELERRESIKEPERRESIKEAERRESIRESEQRESIKEPERRESIIEPERRESIEEPERRESIKEPERRESIKEPERRESIKEPEEVHVEQAEKIFTKVYETTVEETNTEVHKQETTTSVEKTTHEVTETVVHQEETVDHKIQTEGELEQEVIEKDTKTPEEKHPEIVTETQIENVTETIQQTTTIEKIESSDAEKVEKKLNSEHELLETLEEKQDPQKGDDLDNKKEITSTKTIEKHLKIELEETVHKRDSQTVTDKVCDVPQVDNTTEVKSIETVNKTEEIIKETYIESTTTNQVTEMPSLEQDDKVKDEGKLSPRSKTPEDDIKLPQESKIVDSLDAVDDLIKPHTEETVVKDVEEILEDAKTAVNVTETEVKKQSIETIEKLNKVEITSTLQESVAEIRDASEKASEKIKDDVVEAKDEVEKLTTKVEEKVSESVLTVEEKVAEVAPIVHDQIPGVTQKVDEKVDEIIEKVDEKISESTEKALKDVSIPDTVTKVEEKLEEVTTKIDEKISETVTKLEESTATLSEQTDNAKDKVEEQASKVIEKADEITTGVVEKASKIITNVEETTEQVKTKVHEEVVETKKKVEEKFEEAVAQVSEKVLESKHKVEETAATVAEKLSKTEEVVKDKVEKTAEKLTDKLIESEKKADDKVEEMAAQVADKLVESKEKVEETAAKAVDKLEESKDEVQEKVEETAAKANEKLVESKAKVEEVATKIDDKLSETKEIVENKTEAVSSRIEEKLDDAKLKIEEQQEQVTDDVKDAFEKLENQVEKAADKVEEKLEKIPKVAEQIEKKAEQAVPKIEETINKVTDKLEESAANISDLISNKLGSLFSTPHKESVKPVEEVISKTEVHIEDAASSSKDLATSLPPKVDKDKTPTEAILQTVKSDIEKIKNEEEQLAAKKASETTDKVEEISKISIDLLASEKVHKDDKDDDVGEKGAEATEPIDIHIFVDQKDNLGNIVDDYERDALEEKTAIKSVLDDIKEIDKFDKKLQDLKATSESESKSIIEIDIVDKMELGRKSPKEREQDVAIIVASVAEVLKSDAPLEEFEGKIPLEISFGTYPPPYSTELRETHITTVGSPVCDKVVGDLAGDPVTAFLNEERKIAPLHADSESRLTSLIKDSTELMQATSKIISDIKQTKSEDFVIIEDCRDTVLPAIIEKPLEETLVDVKDSDPTFEFCRRTSPVGINEPDQVEAVTTALKSQLDDLKEDAADKFSREVYDGVEKHLKEESEKSIKTEHKIETTVTLQKELDDTEDKSSRKSTPEPQTKVTLEVSSAVSDKASLELTDLSNGAVTPAKSPILSRASTPSIVIMDEKDDKEIIFHPSEIPESILAATKKDNSPEPSDKPQNILDLTKEFIATEQASHSVSDNFSIVDNKADSSSSPKEVSTSSKSPEENDVRRKSTPDIADVTKTEKLTESLTGKTTPPTVPASPITKTKSETIQELSEIANIKSSDVRSSTPASDDCDISSGQVSRVLTTEEDFDKESSDEDDMPGSPLSAMSQVVHSTSYQNDVEESLHFMPPIDPMSASFYGALPDEPPDFNKALSEHREARGEDLFPSGSPSHVYEVTTAKYSSIKMKEGEASRPEESLMTSSFIGTELPESDKKDDPVASWGKPLGLPSPAPLNDNKGTPKKERKVPSNVIAKNKLNEDKKSLDSKYDKKGKKIVPVYMDLTYVPHHGNSNYSYVDFFKRVRARYYVFSGIEPSKEVYNALLEAKQTWEEKDLEVTIISTYDTDVLGYWVAENEDLLTKCKIDLSPSASRCTINLQDHETSCSAYRLEFA